MLGFYGFRGSGKTYEMVRRAHKEFRKNKDTLFLTNTPLFFGDENRVFLWSDPSLLADFMSLVLADKDVLGKRFVLVIIDEANLVLPSRFFADLPKFFLSFLAESRKLNVDVWFTTQHPSRVDTVLREITESWVHCRRFAFVRQMIEKELTKDGVEVEQHGVSLGLLRKGVFKLYDTKYIVGMHGALLPKSAQDSDLLTFLTEKIPEKPLKAVSASLWKRYISWVDSLPKTHVWSIMCDFRALLFGKQERNSGVRGDSVAPPPLGALVKPPV